MIFLKKSKIYLSAMILFGMATTFIFVGCQEEPLSDSPENRIINLTSELIEANNGGEIYFSIPENILAQGEIETQSFIDKLELEGIRNLGEKARIATYLQSIGKTKLANLLNATDAPIDDLELVNKLSTKEINELNLYVLGTTNRDVGCIDNPNATHASVTYECSRNGELVTTSYIYECIGGNWIYQSTSGYDNPHCNGNDFLSQINYCNLDTGQGQRLAAKRQTALIHFIAKEANNQVIDIIHHYIKNKSEIDHLLENDELVKAAYTDFTQNTAQLFTLSSMNNQEAVLDAKTIDAAQTLLTSLAQSVGSEKASKDFNQFANSLDIAKGKELKSALRMIDDFE